MFKKILIANRGEIASRIIHTCKRLQIKTVAIFSKADRDASFVKEADEAFLVGNERVQDSYLNKEKIITIAKDNKVDAIHPGYGLLSENSSFARLCEKNNICFIGPSADHIEKMADKVAARQFMEQHGVPIIPGSCTAVAQEDLLIEAEKIGFPIMLKAAAGGGGVGLAIVQNEKALFEAFIQQSERAQSLFSDKSLYIEKYITNAKHVEIQVARDSHGNSVHLYERECSIQRRNQKVIEEAPCLYISDKTKTSLYEHAINIIDALKYRNLGTIEFLVDEEENIFFLEMNTRIQVEHPVTEKIIDKDLIELQIAIAANQKISFSNQELSIKGHALEARIYAEDPKTFFPSPGKITKFSLPNEQYVRYDFLAELNYVVTPFYDPMIGKVIVHGKNRNEARARLEKILKDIQIEGIATNIPMLIDVLKNETFINGTFDINFVDSYYLPHV